LAQAFAFGALGALPKHHWTIHNSRPYISGREWKALSSISTPDEEAG